MSWLPRTLPRPAMQNYTPQPDSLPDRVCAFFRTHRDEELTTKDIAQKFDVPASGIGNTLASAIYHEWLKRTKDEGGTTIYQAGPSLPNGWGGTPEPAPQAAAARVQRKAPQPAALPAAEQLVIEPDVALPEAMGRVRRSAYEKVFARMERGHSFACPRDSLKSLYSSAKRWGTPKGIKFTSRIVDDHNARIWRIE